MNICRYGARRRWRDRDRDRDIDVEIDIEVRVEVANCAGSTSDWRCVDVGEVCCTCKHASSRRVEENEQQATM
jgi:hypothetical protein